MKLEHILLGVLLRYPSTGYDLKKYLDTTGRFLRSNTQMSQVYRSLSQMQGRGWVVHEIHPRPGAQDAKVYRVTEEGTTIFLDWLTGPYYPSSRMGEPELQARLSFSGFMTIDEIVALLDVELAARREQVARYRFRDRRLPVNPDLPFDMDLAAAVEAWAHHRGVAMVDAHIAVHEDLRRRLLDGDLTVDDELSAYTARATTD